MTDDTDKPPVLRDPDTGRFPKGVSGNPAGRTKGTKNRITLARLMLEEQLRGTLSQAGPKILRKAIKMALAGDDKVMRALLDKMLATPRGDDESNAGDRDVRVIIQNLTGPQPLPAIDGTVIRHEITGPQPNEQGIKPVSNGSGADGDKQVVRPELRVSDAGTGPRKVGTAARRLNKERLKDQP